MATRELLLCEPLLDGGIDDVAFFNGRVLVAEDLADQRDAQIERSRLVAQAGGEGVAHGLVVTATAGNPRAVDIGAGLAVARSGEVLSLPMPVRLALVAPPAAGERTQDFEDCGPAAPLTGVGVYVLVIGSASGPQGSAPAVTLESDGVVRQCGPKYEVDGVRFRLVAVDPVALALAARLDAADQAALTSAGATVDLRRNVLAHLFLGSVERRRFPIEPFIPGEPRYGALDELRASGALGADEVPLAVVSWVNGGIEYLDQWAVRRRLHRAREPEQRLATVGSERVQAEGEACWLQFEQQINDLVRSPISDAVLQTVRAVDHFRYLPAAGLVPFEGQGQRGLDYTRFVETLPLAIPAYVVGAVLPGLVRAGWDLPPVDLKAPDMLWIYAPRETFQAVVNGAVPRPGLYVAFAAGPLAYRANPQFDVSWWDYASFAPSDLTLDLGGTP